MQFRILWNQTLEVQRNRVKALPDAISVKRNDMNMRKNQGEVGSISQKISVEIREFCPEIAVATLRAYWHCHVTFSRATYGFLFTYVTLLCCVTFQWLSLF